MILLVAAVLILGKKILRFVQIGIRACTDTDFDTDPVGQWLDFYLSGIAKLFTSWLSRNLGIALENALSICSILLGSLLGSHLDHRL
jgi:hypothetical protein|tara:strand:+ start:885 stop:1145 length:261 start_codon:yes stop_codon:yes gene_type:complete